MTVVIQENIWSFTIIKDYSLKNPNFYSYFIIFQNIRIVHQTGGLYTKNGKH